MLIFQAGLKESMRLDNTAITAKMRKVRGGFLINNVYLRSFLCYAFVRSKYEQLLKRPAEPGNRAVMNSVDTLIKPCPLILL